jgi:hypothetical protein
MVRLAALDLVLWSVRARMVGVAFDLEIASTNADDRATDAPRLGTPAHAIMDLEALRHVRSIRCRRRTVKEAVLALSGMSNQPRHYLSVPRNRDILPTTGAFDSGIARLESAAMPGRHAASSIGAMTRTPFSP